MSDHGHRDRINGVLRASRAFGDFDYKQNRSLQPWEQQVRHACSSHPPSHPSQVVSVPATWVSARSPLDQFLLVASAGPSCTIHTALTLIDGVQG